MYVTMASALTDRCATCLPELTASARASLTEGLAYSTMQRVNDLRQRYMMAQEEPSSDLAPPQAESDTEGELPTSNAIIKAAIWVTMSCAGGRHQSAIMARLLDELLRRDTEESSKLYNMTADGQPESVESEVEA